MSESTLRPRRSFLKSGLTSVVAAAGAPGCCAGCCRGKRSQGRAAGRTASPNAAPPAATPQTERETIAYPRVFSGRKLACIAFPLGGVCAGTLSLGGRGQLRDWEIFNRPDKGNNPEYAFPGIRVEVAGSKPVARVLEARIAPPYQGESGLGTRECAGADAHSKRDVHGRFPLRPDRLPRLAVAGENRIDRVFAVHPARSGRFGHSRRCAALPGDQPRLEAGQGVDRVGDREPGEAARRPLAAEGIQGRAAQRVA